MRNQLNKSHNISDNDSMNIGNPQYGHAVEQQSIQERLRLQQDNAMSPRVQGPSGTQAPRNHGKKTMFGQASRSPPSRIGGQVKDHGSTEVTTIESYDLVSAVELNMDRTMSRDDEEHEGVNQRGKRDANGERNRLKWGGGNALHSSQGIAAKRANP